MSHYFYDFLSIILAGIVSYIVSSSVSKKSQNQNLLTSFHQRIDEVSLKIIKLYDITDINIIASEIAVISFQRENLMSELPKSIRNKINNSTESSNAYIRFRRSFKDDFCPSSDRADISNLKREISESATAFKNTLSRF